MLKIKELEGNGGFATEECLEFLKEADVVVTNPPFSLFREYMKVITGSGKKYIILGPVNPVYYKDIFPLIKENKLWFSTFNKKLDFSTPNRKECQYCCFYTNIPIKKNDVLELSKTYSPEDYPKYDNYDAIESRSLKIPVDYYGVIGVPISCLKWLWPDGLIHASYKGQPLLFEIINTARPLINGKYTYARILIKRKYVED